MLHAQRPSNQILPESHQERLELLSILHRYDENEVVTLKEGEYRLLEKLEWVTLKNIHVVPHSNPLQLCFDAQLNGRGWLIIELLRVAGSHGAEAVLMFSEQLVTTRQAWIADPESVRLVVGDLRSEELPSTLNRLTELFQRYQWIEPFEAISVAKAFESHHATIALVTESDAHAVKQAREWFETVARPDTLPYYSQTQIGSGDPRADKIYAETLQVMRRAIDLHLGFSSMMYDCRRTPAKRDCLLARFAQDCAKKLEVLFSDSNDHFPGKGYRIEGLLPERLFIPDTNHPGDIFHHYKAAYPWAQEEFRLLPSSSWSFLRGCIVVTSPSESVEVHGVPYSYLVYNEHFLPNATVGGLLVPTQVLEEKLSRCAVLFDDYVGTSKFGLDSIDLTPEALQRECEERGLPIFNLTWGSNFNAGLCNSAPPGNPISHPWEEYSLRISRDIWGHGHKVYAADIMNERIADTPEFSGEHSLELAMVPLQELHSQIYSIAHRYQNLFDLFRLGLGVWRKGLIPPPLNNTNRMLQECYQLHDELIRSGAPESEFPIMAAAPMFTYSVTPSRALLIDLYSMEIVNNGRHFRMPPLDTISSRDEARTLWKEMVVAHIPYNFDLRSYDRGTFLESA